MLTSFLFVVVVSTSHGAYNHQRSSEDSYLTYHIAAAISRAHAIQDEYIRTYMHKREFNLYSSYVFDKLTMDLGYVIGQCRYYHKSNEILESLEDRKTYYEIHVDLLMRHVREKIHDENEREMKQTLNKEMKQNLNKIID